MIGELAIVVPTLAISILAFCMGWLVGRDRPISERPLHRPRGGPP